MTVDVMESCDFRPTVGIVPTSNIRLTSDFK